MIRIGTENTSQIREACFELLESECKVVRPELAEAFRKRLDLMEKLFDKQEHLVEAAQRIKAIQVIGIDTSVLD